LLGVTQAKKGSGCHTDEDRRFERAMHESIDKHRAALLDWEAKRPAPPSAPAGVEAELREMIGCLVSMAAQQYADESKHYAERIDPVLSQQPAAVDGAKETDLWRCTVCGRVGTVGRCCGEETRERYLA